MYEFRCSKLGDFTGEVDGDYSVDADGFYGFEPGVEVHEVLGPEGRGEDGERVVAEGYDGGIQASTLGLFDGAAEKGLVAEVDAVEHSDGYGGVGVGWGAGELFQQGVDLYPDATPTEG